MHVGDGGGQVEGHDRAHFLGHILQVRAVAHRQDHLLQSCPVGCQHLLLDPTDGQHPALQGDLTRHADHRTHRDVTQQADQGRGHRDPGRGTVLGDGAGRHVHVEPLLGKDGRVDPELDRVRPHVGEGDLRRLLHDVAQLAGQGQPFRTVGHAGLDEEDVAARTGHGQSGHDTRHTGPVGRFEEEAWPSQPLAHVVRIHRHRGLTLAGRQLGGHLAQQPPDLTLQGTDTRLAGVSLGTAPADVDVEPLGEDRRVDPELRGVRAHVGEGDLRRLLHDVAQLAREGETLGAVGHAGLDEEDVAAGTGHGQAGDHAGHAGAVGRLEEEVWPAEPAPHVVRCRPGPGPRARRRRVQWPPCATAAELALEGPDTRLPGVVGHDGPQRFVA